LSTRSSSSSPIRTRGAGETNVNLARLKEELRQIVDSIQFE
jgi:hypothetical protein